MLLFCHYVAYVIITMALIKHGIGVKLLIHFMNLFNIIIDFVINCLNELKKFN